jgi:hypothetical protein
MNREIRCLGLLLLTTAFGACSDDDEGQTMTRTLEHSQSMIPSVFFSDGDGKPIDSKTTPDSAIIQKVVQDPMTMNTELFPVLAPDGHQVTWGEFKKANGTAKMTCVEGGTNLSVTFKDLIPQGTYTAWLVLFEAPGFLAKGFEALTGFSPAGPADGSQSVFKADASGNASLTVLTPSAMAANAVKTPAPTIPGCLLDAYEVHIVGLYHIDGKTCGSNPCEEKTGAEHIAWMFSEGKVLSPPM